MKGGLVQRASPLTKCAVVVVIALVVILSVLYISNYSLLASIPTTTDESPQTDESQSKSAQDAGRRDGRAGLVSHLEKYRLAAAEGQKAALAVLESKTGWTRVAGDRVDAKGVVYKKSTTKWGSVYKLEATIDIAAKVLFDDMIYKLEDVPKWNPTLLKNKILLKINNNTEIVYSVSASWGAGIISSRDFVYVRHWEKLDGWYVSSSVSVQYPSAPSSSKYVRAEQHPTMIRMKELGPRKLSIQWLLNVDIKGSIPRFMAEPAFPGTLVDYLKHLRKRATALTNA